MWQVPSKRSRFRSVIYPRDRKSRYISVPGIGQRTLKEDQDGTSAQDVHMLTDGGLVILRELMMLAKWKPIPT